MIKKYIFNVLMALDILLNAIAGGSYREPISSRIGKNPKCSFLAEFLHKILNWLENNHCEDSAKRYSDVKKEDNVF